MLGSLMPSLSQARYMALCDRAYRRLCAKRTDPIAIPFADQQRAREKVQKLLEAVRKKSDWERYAALCSVVQVNSVLDAERAMSRRAFDQIAADAASRAMARRLMCEGLVVGQGSVLPLA